MIEKRKKILKERISNARSKKTNQGNEKKGKEKGKKEREREKEKKKGKERKKGKEKKKERASRNASDLDWGENKSFVRSLAACVRSEKIDRKIDAHFFHVRSRQLGHHIKRERT